MGNSPSSDQPSSDPPITPPIDPTEDATSSHDDSDSDDESWSSEYSDTPQDDEEHEADVQETSGRGRFALTSGPETDGPWHGGNGMRRAGRGADRRTWWRQWMEMKRPRLRRAEQLMFWVWLIWVQLWRRFMIRLGILLAWIAGGFGCFDADGKRKRRDDRRGGGGGCGREFMMEWRL